MILPLMETTNKNKYTLNKQTNKTPVLAPVAIIKHRRLSGLITKIYFWQFRRLRSPQSKCQQARFHSEASSLSLYVVAISLYAHMTSFFSCVEKERASSLVSCLIGVLIPLWGPHPHNLIEPTRSPSPNTITLGGSGLQCMIIWIDTAFITPSQ